MQEIFLAPELSATSRMDRIWIIGLACPSPVRLVPWRFRRTRQSACGRLSGLGGRLLDPDASGDHLPDPPALARREGPALHNLHHVAHAALLLLVVGHEPGGLLDKALVERVLDEPLDGDHDCLRHPVAGDHAHLYRSMASLLRHSYAPAFPAAARSSSRDRSLVLTRARSRRAARILCGFSTRPTASWQRRSNSRLVRSCSSRCNSSSGMSRNLLDFIC